MITWYTTFQAMTHHKTNVVQAMMTIPGLTKINNNHNSPHVTVSTHGLHT